LKDPEWWYPNEKNPLSIKHREKQNEKYLAAHHKVSPMDIDLLENGWATVIEGSDSDYNYLKNILGNNDDSGVYSYINQQLDISQYLDYLATEIYLGNYDWPLLNIKFWKERRENRKWRQAYFTREKSLDRESSQ